MIQPHYARSLENVNMIQPTYTRSLKIVNMIRLFLSAQRARSHENVNMILSLRMRVHPNLLTTLCVNYKFTLLCY